MKLRNPDQTPIGGFYFVTEDGRRIYTDSSLRTLQRLVRGYLESNELDVPEDLDHVIEDQICMRQPEGKCKYVGIGDRVAQAIHIVADVVDAVAGTQFKTKAKRCGSCAKRRNKLNNL